ncbi:unnamed protein product, partial [marine sediment metagenome]
RSLTTADVTTFITQGDSAMISEAITVYSNKKTIEPAAREISITMAAIGITSR